MWRAACVFLPLIVLIACPIGSSSEARADLIVPTDGMSCTPESGSFELQGSDAVVSLDLDELILVLFNPVIDTALCNRSTGGASGASTGSSSVENGPSPQVALLSRYEIDLPQIVFVQRCENRVFTPQTLISGVFRPPRNAT